MKAKSIKLSDYFEIRKPTYQYLKLIPDSSIRNYNSSAIANAMALMYKDIFHIIKRENKKIVYETNFKLSYMIDITKTEVGFYFIVPTFHLERIKEKIRNTWKRCTIEEIKEIKPFKEEAVKYQLYNAREDALSLAVDKKNNDPLNALLNIVEIMSEDDRMAIFYNFVPCNQGNWKSSYKRTIDKLQEGKPVDRDVTPGFVVKSVFAFINDILSEAINMIFGNESKKKNTDLGFLEAAMGIVKNYNLTPATEKKKNANIIDTQIMVLSEAVDTNKAESNAITLCQNFNCIAEDNELKFKPIKEDKKRNVWYVDDFKIAGAETSKFSIDECSNFVQLPGRELQDRFGMIKKINTMETEVPKDLQQGAKCIGTNTFKGTKTKVHLSSDKDFSKLCLAVIGPTRSGKTTLLGNLAKDSINNGESVIILDYIENCGLSEDIKAMIPNDKILEVNLSDTNNLQGMGYNEAIIETDDIFKKYEMAKKQTAQVLTLINSINVGNSDFTPRMERFLESACIVAFIQNKAVRDILRILEDFRYREECIKTIPKDMEIKLQKYVNYLRELDEWSKATKENPSEKIDTKINLISGVLDRFNKLSKNVYMEEMLARDIKDNFNLLKEMEKNKAIFIKLPEDCFATADERDIMVTYWLSKIWLAAQVRASMIPDRYKRKTVTVITDEIAQLEASEELVGSKLDQCAKFAVKFVLSTMYINQLRIRDKLRTANTSYMFISGAEKSNFKELKEEFEQFGFQLEDMLKLKRYHSLNYIKYEEGYWAGITELPYVK